jgi:hypothetical protein
MDMELNTSAIRAKQYLRALNHPQQSPKDIIKQQVAHTFKQGNSSCECRRCHLCRGRMQVALDDFIEDFLQEQQGF